MATEKQDTSGSSENENFNKRKKRKKIRIKSSEEEEELSQETKLKSTNKKCMIESDSCSDECKESYLRNKQQKQKKYIIHSDSSSDEKTNSFDRFSSKDSLGNSINIQTNQKVLKSSVSSNNDNDKDSDASSCSSISCDDNSSGKSYNQFNVNDGSYYEKKKRRSSCLMSKSSMKIPSPKQTYKNRSTQQDRKNLKQKRITTPFIYERNSYRTDSTSLIENDGLSGEDDNSFIASSSEEDYEYKNTQKKKLTRKRKKDLIDVNEVSTITTKNLRSREKQPDASLEKLKTFRSIKNLPFDKRALIKDKLNSDSDASISADVLSYSDEDFINDSIIDLDSGLKRVVKSSSSGSDLEKESLLTEEEISFFENVAKNNFSVIEEVLKKKNFKNLIDHKGQTALHIAAFNGFSELVRILLDYGSNPDLKDSYQHYPLTYAALNKQLSCFKLLLPVTKSSLDHNVLHLLSSKCLVDRDFFNEFVMCIIFLKEYDSGTFYRYLCETDNQGYTPVMVAITNDLPEIVKTLLTLMFDDDLCRQGCFDFQTEEGGTLLHFSSQFSCSCLAEVLPYFQDYIDKVDFNGFTALMYACEVGSADSVRLLLESFASVNEKDKTGVTALHLASASGAIDSVKLLLDFGHKVDCLDEYGWPPLLYANFQSDENLVLLFLSQKPEQIFCLGHLLSANDSEIRDKNVQVIRNVFLSMSHIDSYYTLFNDFIASNLSLLDENNNSVFASTWRTILSFKNKLKWMKMKVKPYTQSLSICEVDYVEVDRNNVIESAMKQLPEYFFFSNMEVRFKGEKGSCLGPKREFVDSFVQEITSPELNILRKGDNNQYIPVGNSYCFDQLKGLSENLQKFSQQLKKRLEILHFFGKFTAQVVLSDDINMSLQIASIVVKQLLGIHSESVSNLKTFDSNFYSNIKDNILDDLNESFAFCYTNSWTGNPGEVLLDDDAEKLITDDNKEDYLNRVAEFMFHTSIETEINVFKQGFCSHIPNDVISIFNVEEFSLLLNGVTKIDISDWRKHTLYEDFDDKSPVITWFWKTVESLIEEEKALLLKFCTGSPCVPIGGFSNLKGLGGMGWFKIQKYKGIDRLPEAGTCFNTLRLPSYSNEKVLRKNLLIAIRHGSVGFEFA